MENRIQSLFGSKKRNLLSVFYTAGFPKLTSTLPVAKSLQDAGADLIEIGIPFSDPVADGPTIQESNKIALENGMTLRRILDDVRDMRKHGITVPLVLMGYVNPVLQYGVERFAKDAAAAGVDGVIIPDLPADEYDRNYKTHFESNNLCFTFLVSPTTSEERVKRIDAVANGFIYAVSASSTTGARDKFSDEQIQYFARLKGQELKNPFLIGFGISNRTTFETACTYGSGAIVGSAFIKTLKDLGDSDSVVREFVHSLKGSKV